MKQISFIHAADLHLDSPLLGLKSLPAELFERARESTFKALKKITDAAISNRVDFVILAGDLFDGEDRSLRAQSRLRKEMLKLAEYQIPIYCVHGNHDHLNGSWVELDMPETVHIFGPDVEMKQLETKSGEIIHFYGFSYPKRHVFERKIIQYQRRDGADFHIGILHGNEGSTTEHDNYAPFTIKELNEKGFNYWALGHIHKRMILSENPPIIYPGNIQGRNKKETGVKGFYHVILTEEDSKLNFIESSEIVWEEAHIDARDAKSFSEIFRLCQLVKEERRKEKRGTFLTLNIENIHLDDERERRSLNSELLDLLTEDEKNEEAFVWPVDLIVSESVKIDKEQLHAEAQFYRELYLTVKEYHDLSDSLADLYEHHHARKYLPKLAEPEQQELIERAEKLLVDLLYKGGV